MHEINILFHTWHEDDTMDRKKLLNKTAAKSGIQVVVIYIIEIPSFYFGNAT